MAIPRIVHRYYVFVMGDNRNVSHDGIYYDIGLINEAYILAKAEFIILPFN